MNKDNITSAFYDAMNDALSSLLSNDKYEELTEDEFAVVYHMVEWTQTDTPQYINEFVEIV